MSKALSIARSLSPFGPVFGKELRTTARRKRTYLLRFFYLLALMLILLMAWAPSAERTQHAGLIAKQQAQAELGGKFFIAFALFSVATMALVGPILTATAIGSERLQKTLPVLLMTPISSWQIVAGKLSSRLLTAMTLLGLSLPVLALVRLLGSVEIHQMVAAVCVAMAVAVFAAAIGLFFSALMTRAYAVILLAYATLGLIYLFIPMIIAITSNRPTPGIATFFSIANPFFVVVRLEEPSMPGLPGIMSWLAVVISHVSAALVLLLFTAALVRRMARRQFVGEKSSSDAPFEPVATSGILPPPLPGSFAVPPPSPTAGVQPFDYESPVGAVTLQQMQARKAWRPVGNNPVISREARQPLLKKLWMRIVGLIAVIAMMLITYSSIGFSRTSGMLSEDPHKAIAVAVDLLLVVLVCVLSATSVAQEKESDTWTLLLATPLRGRDIVLGKIVGVLRRIIWPLAIIVANFLFFTVVDAITFSSFCIIVWVILTFNAIWIATGIWLSLRLRKVTVAVVVNLLLPLVFYLGSALGIELWSELLHDGSMSDWPSWYLPFVYLVDGIRGPQVHYGRYSHYGMGNPWNKPQPLQYGHLTPEQSALVLICVGLAYLLAAYLLIQWTISNFDRIVKRAPQNHPLPKNPLTAAK